MFCAAYIKTRTSQAQKQNKVATVLSKMAEERSDSPPPGFKKVETRYWEAVMDPRSKRQPVNGHTGIYAYHCDDCMCSMGGWRCYRDGHIWSCCGQTDKYCHCTEAKGKEDAEKQGQKK